MKTSLYFVVMHIAYLKLHIMYFLHFASCEMKKNVLKGGPKNVLRRWGGGVTVIIMNIQPTAFIFLRV